jgi:hypothetical protein
MIFRMKLAVQVRLLPDNAQEAALRATLQLAGQAANLVSEVAWSGKSSGTSTCSESPMAR